MGRYWREQTLDLDLEIPSLNEYFLSKSARGTPLQIMLGVMASCSMISSTPPLGERGIFPIVSLDI